MDGNKKLWERRLNGTVEVKKIPRTEWSPTKADHLIKAKYIYTWQPPYQVACQLPDGFSLSFDCWESKEGGRAFTPCKPCRAFALEGALAGHAILADRDEDKTTDDLPHHQARLFNQFSRHMREYLGTTLKLGRLLKINPTGRPDRATKDILPEDVGSSACGSGTRWTVSRFRTEGLRAAREAGIAKPTPDQVAWYGLFAAARLFPLEASDGEAASLVRLALYALPPEKVPKGAVAYVTEQVQASLKGQLKCSTEEFDRWIKDGKANLIHRITKRTDCKLNSEQVRSALLELGWRSFQQLGHCLDVVMRAFREALPKPLTRAELRMFSRTFLAHRDTGGLPLVLLFDRFDALKPAILATWDNPTSRPAVQVLWRVIYWYCEVVGKRRAGDKEYRRRAKSRNYMGRAALDLPFFDETDSADADEDVDESGKPKKRRPRIREKF